MFNPEAPIPVSSSIDLAATAVTDSFSAHKTIDLSGLQDNKGGYSVGSNTEVTFKAPENRSTGYQWNIASNTCGARFYQASDVYNKNSNSNLMGAGGERVWKFNSLTPDANYIRGLPCKLTFTYKRPWEKDANAVADMKEVTITVGN